MSLKFTTKEARDDLAERLALLANDMISAWDQGHDGRIICTTEMVEIIQTAACVVACAEIVDGSSTYIKSGGTSEG